MDQTNSTSTSGSWKPDVTAMWDGAWDEAPGCPWSPDCLELDVVEEKDETTGIPRDPHTFSDGWSLLAPAQRVSNHRTSGSVCGSIGYKIHENMTCLVL